MTIEFVSSTDIPKKGMLIVCAGTVTCHHVHQMGAGFSVFKRYFSEGQAYDDNERCWEEVLTHRLHDYFHEKKPMPAFQLIAKSNDFLGGVATVPYLHGKIGLDPSRPAPTHQDLEHDYISAVKGAIDSARALERRLYLQPLGIGVYGWTGERAAALFSLAIKARNTDDKLSITIPLFRSEPDSNDQRFKIALQTHFK